MDAESPDSEREPTRQPRLDDLVERARTDLREWTDHTDSDPGIALLELFAYVGDLLSSYAERVADEAYLGTGRGRHGHRRKGAAGDDSTTARP
jgi:hypothetical protein